MTKEKDEFASFLSTDILKDYLRILRRFPTATAEENRELHRRVRAGNEEARELMINKNTALVINIVMGMNRKLNSMEKEDLINEGIIGLMKAIDAYDESEGAFSTYATKSIKRRINRGIFKKDKTIKRPEYVEVASNKLAKVKEQYSSLGKELPSVQELSKLLNVSKETVEQIEKNENSFLLSLDEPLSGDEEKSTLSTFVGHDEERYSSFLNSLYQDELLAWIKENCSKIEYYIIYYKLIFGNVKSEKIAKNFAVTKQQIDQLYHKVLNRIKILFDQDRTFKGHISKEIRKAINTGTFRREPLEPINVVLYLFIKDILNETEKEIFKSKYLRDEKYNLSTISRRLLIPLNLLKQYESQLEKKISHILAEQKEEFETFYREMTVKYKTKILDKAIPPEEIEIKKDYGSLLEKWQNCTYDELLNHLSTIGETIPSELERKVKRYFGVVEINSIRGAFKKINFFEAGFVDDKYRIEAGIKASENIINYKSYNFSKKRYIALRSSALESVEKIYIEVLDRYYGLFSKPYSIEDLSIYLEMEPENANNFLQTAKEKILNVYIGRTVNLKLDFDIYRNYLCTHKIDLSEPANSILRMFLFENKSYEEIAEKFSITTTRVSVYITTGLKKIDYFRLGIYTYEPYPREVLTECLNAMHLSDTLKTAILEYLDTKDAENIKNRYGIDRKMLEKNLKILYKNAATLMLKEQKLTVEEIAREIDSPEYTNVISIDGRVALSLYYSIKNKYNEDGSICRGKELETRLQKPLSTIYSRKDLALTKIKAKILGLERNILDIIDVAVLSKALKDPHLPLKTKDVELLELLYGLNGKERKSLAELCSTESEKTILIERFRKAIITVKKYLNREIDGIVCFEESIEPFLKFFTYKDRKILEDIYKNRLTYAKVAQKNGITEAYMNYLMLRLKVYLKDLQTGEIEGFDFDYFWQTVRNEDVPIYSHKELAIEMFYLYFECNMSANEVILKMGLKMSQDMVLQSIRYLYHAVQRYRKGFRKEKDIPYEAIRDFYLRNQASLTLYEKSLFYRYFNLYNQKTVSLKRLVPIRIVNLISSYNGSYVAPKNVTPLAAKNLLKKYQNMLSDTEKDAIIGYYSLNSREFMKGSDQRQVLNYLMSLKEPTFKSYYLKPQSPTKSD